MEGENVPKDIVLERFTFREEETELIEEISETELSLLEKEDEEIKEEL